MRRLVIILPLLLLACGVLTPFSPTASLTPPAVPSSSPPVAPSPTLAVTPSPTLPVTPSPALIVRYHPDGPLYVGDQVSIEVIAPLDVNLKDQQVRVRLDWPTEMTLGSAGFGAHGISGRFQATFTWIWDTRNLGAGSYPVTFSIQPEGPSWTETISLSPAEAIPPPQPQAHWKTVTTVCCVIHYITGTDAARDLPALLILADEQAIDATRRMSVAFSDPIPVTLLPRVLGHGGFAGDEIYVSYLERNYAGNDFSQVLHHEMIHILDGRLGGDFRPSLLVEGLAVYLSDGHFKIEPLLSRAAALLILDWYLPLAPLADDFYNSQHEIGYLEGAALVSFMVNTWGWPAFSDFYRDIHPQPSGKQSDALDTTLQAHFSLTLQQLESRFLVELRRQHLNPDLYDDVRLSVAYYNTVRRYQQLLDPSAYFLTAWLPDGKTMRQRGIVADYLRHPTQPENLVLEILLVSADEDLRAGNYLEAEKVLAVVNAALDTIEKLPGLPQIPVHGD